MLITKRANAVPVFKNIYILGSYIFISGEADQKIVEFHHSMKSDEEAFHQMMKYSFP
jgi:5'-3' exonuclease